MAKFNTKSISNRGTFCNFSLAPKGKIYKTSMKHLKIHKFPFKNVIVLTIECKMYLKIQQKTSLPWLHLKTDQRSVMKKTRLNSWEDDFLMKSFPSSTKRKLSIFFELSLSIFLSFNGVVLSLKCRTLVLKHLHGDRASAIVLKMDICH